MIFLPLEIVQRILSFTSNPLIHATVSKQWYTTATSKNTMLLWLKNNTHSKHADHILQTILLANQAAVHCLSENHPDSLNWLLENFSLNKLLSLAIAHKNCFLSQAILPKINSKMYSLTHHVHQAISQNSSNFTITFINQAISTFGTDIYPLLIMESLLQSKYEITEYLVTRVDLTKIHLAWFDIPAEQYLQLLKIAYSQKQLVKSSEFIAERIESVTGRDMPDALEFLIDCDLVDSFERVFRLACLRNSTKCVEILMDTGMDIHFDDHVCLYEVAAAGYTRLTYMLVKDIPAVSAQEALYYAIENDQPEVVIMLLKMPETQVKVDQRSFWLAIRVNGKRVESTTCNTVLKLLLRFSPDVVYLKEIGKTAARNFKDYCINAYQNRLPAR